MKTLTYSLLFIVLYGTSAFGQQKVNPIAVEPGVSIELATFRRSLIHDIEYTLNFDIPSGKSENIQATETLSFVLGALNQPLQLDFKQDRDHLTSIKVNGKDFRVNIQNEHILIDAAALAAGRNEIRMNFIAGDASLNRNPDFLYALFVPDRARTVFPCFDQPDLKARFLLTLKVPLQWKVLANAVKKDSVIENNGIVFHFNNSDRLPIYLFSFTAGKYTSVMQKTDGLPAEFLHRETDSLKIKLSVDSIFDAHQNAIRFLQKWTGIPFPFQKVGLVAIPDFQYGGMEHPGEVQYRSSALFLDSGATKDQFISRSSLISHETSHMWFGDLVTMKWFNDVWMKEVFANFMADKVTEKMMGLPTYNLRFLQHYPYAYSVDRTLGANPIRQQLTNLKDAGSLYGDIIYEKAPVMMRQLELLIGKENFRKGVDEYLKKYAYRNADWSDLIAILSKYTKRDLYLWNKVWVNQPGRPELTYTEKDHNNVIQKFVISQHAESGPKRYWPQYFTLTFFYADHQQSIPVNISGPAIDLTAAKGLKAPQYIVFNSNGLGYGIFPFDKKLANALYSLSDPLQRASIYINAYENMLSGKQLSPKDLLLLFLKGLSVEKNEMDLRLLAGNIRSIYWKFITPADRLAMAEKVESSFWQAMQAQSPANNKKILFKGYQDEYMSQEAAKKIYDIWKNQRAPAGVKLTEDDYTELALTIALKTDSNTEVLSQQRDRIKNADRKDRLTFLMPALSPDEKERDAFFYGLADKKNRQKETWVATGLTYLNHPQRQKTSIKYLPESLDLLEEIQRTGDVFFPQSWLTAVFGRYQSKKAYSYVTDFLKKHPAYNPKLKEKILQSTDDLYRAQKGLVN
ncbi:MAG: M1 family aminopeptidase [Bacteroidota bacterium]